MIQLLIFGSFIINIVSFIVFYLLTTDEKLTVLNLIKCIGSYIALGIVCSIMTNLSSILWKPFTMIGDGMQLMLQNGFLYFLFVVIFIIRKKLTEEKFLCISTALSICIIDFATGLLMEHRILEFDLYQINLFRFKTIIVSHIIKFLIFMIIYQWKKNYIYKANIYDLELQIRSKEEYYEEIGKRYIEVEKWKHDIKNYLMGYIPEYNIDKIIHMIDAERIYTQNKIVNYILNRALEQCRDLDIYVRHDIVLPESIKISGGELGVLFGNIFDNVIEALSNYDGDRVFELDIKCEYEYLYIHERNAYAEEYYLKRDNNRRGQGIKSIRQIVEKYQGTVLIKNEDGVYDITIVFYNI